MPAKASLNVSLTPELTAYVTSLVAAGQYRSASEVVRAGLRLLQRENTTLKTAPGQIARKEVSDTTPPGKRRQREHGWRKHG
jgi:antitoxin ParD1/3/4